jgi:hypothetical protein
LHVHVIEKRRKALHLVDQDPASRLYCSQLRRKRRRIGQIGLVPRLLEKIDVMGAREFGAGPGAFAGSPRPEKKEGCFEGAPTGGDTCCKP